MKTHKIFWEKLWLFLIGGVVIVGGNENRHAGFLGQHHGLIGISGQDPFCDLPGPSIELAAIGKIARLQPVQVDARILAVGLVGHREGFRCGAEMTELEVRMPKQIPRPADSATGSVPAHCRRAPAPAPPRRRSGTCSGDRPPSGKRRWRSRAAARRLLFPPRPGCDARQPSR